MNHSPEDELVKDCCPVLMEREAFGNTKPLAPPSIHVSSSPHMIMQVQHLEISQHHRSQLFCCIFPKDLFLQPRCYRRGFIQFESYVLYVK